MTNKYSGLMKPTSSIDEENLNLIKNIFLTNSIKEKIDRITELNTIDLTNYVKYKTTFNYEIHWSYKSDNIIILIRNNGIFDVNIK